MSEILLLISDEALRDAVIEQIHNAKLGSASFLENDIEAALKGEEKTPPKIVIVDDKSPDKKIKALFSTIEKLPEKPSVLMFGADNGGEAVTETFQKPFRLGHLLARLKYYLETAPLLRNKIVTFGPYRLEPQTRRVLRENEPEPIKLTEKETALLVFLAQKKGFASRQEILAYVWGYDERIDTHTLETHVYQLRRKLDKEGENWLLNEAGTYRLSGVEE